MKKSKFFFIIIILILTSSIKALNAEEKISYLDIDYVIANTLVGKSVLNSLKNEENLTIDKFKLIEEDFKNKEIEILAKKNLISKEEITKELKLLQKKFKKYREEKIKKVDQLKVKRNKNIINFLNLINPIIEKYMTDNSIYLLIDKKNVFIASKDYDITNNLIELIDNQIKTTDIK